MASKFTINICMGSSCFARGNQEHLAFIEKIITDNSLANRIELSGRRCENKCAKGPFIDFNGKEYGNINTEEIVKILKEHFPEIIIK